MKRIRYQVMVATLVAGGLLAIGSAAAQEDAKRERKPSATAQNDTADHAKKVESKQQDKLQSLRTSLNSLVKKRAKLAASQGKESDEVVALTAHIDQVKQRVAAMRNSSEAATAASQAKKAAGEKAKVAIAKLQTKKKTDQEIRPSSKASAIGKKNKASANQARTADANVRIRKVATADDVRQLLKSHGIVSDGGEVDLETHKGANGESIVVVRKKGLDGDSQQRVHVITNSEGDDRDGAKHEHAMRLKSNSGENRYEDGESHFIFRGDSSPGNKGPAVWVGDRREDESNEIRPGGSNRNRPSARDGQGSDAARPMELTRRLKVIEDRLNGIEHKLNAILERLQHDAPRRDNANSNRGPSERRLPPGNVRHEGPSRGDGDQMRRPPRPDQPPAQGRGEGMMPPPGEFGPPPDDDRQMRRPPRPDQPPARGRGEGMMPPPGEFGPPPDDDRQMRRRPRPDSPPPGSDEDFGPPRRGDRPPRDE